MAEWFRAQVTDPSFYESASSNPFRLLFAQNSTFQYSSLESVWVQLLIPSVLSYLILVFQD